MSLKSKRKKSSKKRILAYFFFLFLPGFLSLFLYMAFYSSKPLFISPIGKTSDTSSVEKLLKSKNIFFSSVSLSGLTYIVKIQNNALIKLSSQKDIKLQVSSLQRILRVLTIEGKPFKIIDFRFNEPIISFE